MALTDENMVMPVAPMNGNGFGSGFGGDGWWILLLFILLGGNGFGGWGGRNTDGGLYPWMNQADLTNSGFRDQAFSNQLNGIQSGVQGLSTQMCNGFAGVNATINGGFANAETAANARQMANMNQAFGMQTAITGGMTNLSQQLSQCCCDNRLATCQTQNVIQSESANTRFADASNTRDIIQSQTAGTQAILNKLCQLELDNYKTQLDAKNDLIAQLRQENLYARGQASQDIQTAELRANNVTVANQLVNELRSCPIPSMPVYGNNQIFSCNGGCSCAA